MQVAGEKELMAFLSSQGTWAVGTCRRAVELRILAVNHATQIYLHISSFISSPQLMLLYLLYSHFFTPVDIFDWTFFFASLAMRLRTLPCYMIPVSLMPDRLHRASNQRLWAYDTGRQDRKQHLVIRIRVKRGDGSLKKAGRGSRITDNMGAGQSWNEKELGIEGCRPEELAVVVVGELLPPSSLTLTKSQPVSGERFNPEVHTWMPMMDGTLIVISKLTAARVVGFALVNNRDSFCSAQPLATNDWERQGYYSEWTRIHKTTHGSRKSAWHQAIRDFSGAKLDLLLSHDDTSRGVRAGAAPILVNGLGRLDGLSDEDSLDELMRQLFEGSDTFDGSRARKLCCISATVTRAVSDFPKPISSPVFRLQIPIPPGA